MTSDPSPGRPVGPRPGREVLYISDQVLHALKHRHNVCGDHHLCRRTFEATSFVLADGIGSGVRANVAAIMCAHRLLHLLANGISLARASEMVVSMMHRARTEEGIPFAAFSLAHVLNSGHYTVLSYESPPPVLVRRGTAELLPLEFFPRGHEVVGEASGVLRPGEALILMSDGVTQAGLGRMKGMGWGEERVVAEINSRLDQRVPLEEIPQEILDRARELSGGQHGDDTSMAVLACREANVLNLMTGPPQSRDSDQAFVERFLAQAGEKVVCGSTTADLVARVTGNPLKLLEVSTSFASPPTYRLEGLDLVTEGAITLNQVYNLLEEDLEEYEGGSCVGQICRMLKRADVVHLFVGGARNPGNVGLEFKQLGVLPRHLVVGLLAEKLRALGKLVVGEGERGTQEGPGREPGASWGSGWLAF